MNLKPIKTKKIYEEIIEQIRVLVIKGELKPGDRLPSERDLAVRFNVSRASVREALSALEMMGLVEIRSGEGTFIKEVNLDSVVTPLAWILSMEKDTLIELLEVRKMLEGQTVALAAKRAGSQDLRELEDALQAMLEDMQTGKVGEEADMRFHYAIAGASKNKILLRLMNAISDTMHQSLKASRVRLYEGNVSPERLYKEHVFILEAVTRQNEEDARRYMLEHLAGVEERLLRYYSSNDV
ncbi:transcriptional regulator [Desulfitobacterium dichloroeliminans LMG P-21439]|uniref:Transcriptional regulator n=1 Tax=Desulfitobacterium dichloroeliminans (strain LMG P-21439 / DCA1) TaxID=871963 RepID=L0F7G6_DESDL|nr:FadR/GntR family transcriptional regulator [Desulfitobacterium dichloroeliminans]AGA69784.1 transcriptional regulator [Desulfitobacterium dichloroeliminans LMG P-21439]